MGYFSVTVDDTAVAAYNSYIIFHFDMIMFSAGAVFVFFWRGCKKGEGSLGSAKVRRTHSGKLNSIKLFSRKSNGYSEHTAEYPLVSQEFPKRDTFS